MKKLLALVLALTMTLSITACGGKSDEAPDANASGGTQTEKTSDPIIVNISHTYAESDQINEELKIAQKNIEARTNGGVVVNLYPNGTLGNLIDGAEAVLSNSPLLLVTTYSSWEDVYYDASALQCGFVFEDGEEFHKLMETELFAKLVEDMDKVNVHALNSAFVGGMRHVIGKKAYSTPADVKGLKLRVTNAAPYLECWQAMGASPMGMAASEQLSALSAGTVDALDQAISQMYFTKSYELAKHATLTGQELLADAMFCSTTWWNTLPAEYQEIIEEEVHDAGIRYSDYSAENEDAMRAEMEAAGVTFYEADRQAFLDMGCGDLVLKYGIGQELLDTLAEIRAGN